MKQAPSWLYNAQNDGAVFVHSYKVDFAMHKIALLKRLPYKTGKSPSNYKGGILYAIHHSQPAGTVEAAITGQEAVQYDFQNRHTGNTQVGDIITVQVDYEQDGQWLKEDLRWVPLASTRQKRYSRRHKAALRNNMQQEPQVSRDLRFFDARGGEAQTPAGGSD